MYQVYCDGYCIYDPRIPERIIFDAQLELELNKTGTFTFTIYPTHPYFDDSDLGDFFAMQSVVEVIQNGETVFSGRVLNVESGFYNEKRVTCEGELAILLDSIIEPHGTDDDPHAATVKEYLSMLIAKHNAMMAGSDWKHFTLGTISPDLKDKPLEIAESEYRSPWELITEHVIGTHGGYIWLRREGDINYIDYLTHFDISSNQPIELGRNLLDLKKTIKGEEIVTCLFPIGGSGDNSVTIESVNRGSPYLISKNADTLGRIFKVVKFDDIDDPTKLKEEAEAYLKKHEGYIASVELTAADLAGVEEGANPFKLGQKIQVIDNKHGLDDLESEDGGFLVEKLSLSILTPTNNKLTVGATFSTFTEKANAANSSQSKLAQKAGNVVTLNTLNNAMKDVVKTNALEDYYAKGEEEDLLGLIYPVGAIYISVADTSPAVLFGGTWERIKDRFLLGAGDTYSAGLEAGEAEHTLTVDEMPSHGHTVSGYSTAGGTSGGAGGDAAGDAYAMITSETGGGLAHNNMPPYLAVYIWKRTA